MNESEPSIRLGYQKISLEDAGFRIDLQVLRSVRLKERILVVGHLGQDHCLQSLTGCLEQARESCILALKILETGIRPTILELSKRNHRFLQNLRYKFRLPKLPLFLKGAYSDSPSATGEHNAKANPRSEAKSG